MKKTLSLSYPEIRELIGTVLLLKSTYEDSVVAGDKEASAGHIRRAEKVLSILNEIGEQAERR
jgi:hypothetical protein